MIESVYILCVWESTCLYLLTEKVPQYIIIDITNQDKTAVVRENVLLELLQLLDTENTFNADNMLK